MLCLTTYTICKHCWLIRYETDMCPELSTAAADQNFALICKQHQDLIGSVLIFRTKIIWSGPEFGLVRCGYLNTAIGTVYKTNLVRTKSLSDHGPDQIWLCKRYLSVPKIWSGPKSGPKRDLFMCKDHGPIEFGPVPNLDM